MERTPGKAFYHRQIAALEARDTDALLTQYHPDVTMVGFDVTVKGHAAIRKHFDSIVPRFGSSVTSPLHHPSVLIIDEFGYTLLSSEQSHHFFDLVTACDERGRSC